MIERERWGGSCPNVACTPTKAYLVAAELAHDVNTLAPRVGIEAGPARVDLARVRAWKETLKKAQEQWVRDLEAAGFATLPTQVPSFCRRRTSLAWPLTSTRLPFCLPVCAAACPFMSITPGPRAVESFTRSNR